MRDSSQAHPIEFAPELAWMAPLVDRVVARGLVPAGSVRQIASWKPEASPGGWDAPYGLCEQIAGEEQKAVGCSGQERYGIYIATHSPLSTLSSGLEYRPLPLEELLDTLAHELAHTRVAVHGGEHDLLTEEILMVLSEEPVPDRGAAE